MQNIQAQLQKFAYLSASFRTMFFLAALAGFLVPPIWIGLYLNEFSYLGFFKNVFNWHSHEMIFGFTMALISGFLLTAGANWSGNRPRTGLWLLALALFWLLERIALFLPIHEIVSFFLNLPFILLFIIMAGLTLKGNRNFKIMIPLLLAFFLGKEMIILGDHFESESFVSAGRDFSLGLIRFLLALIACRLIPFFTSKRFPIIGLIPLPIILRGSFLTSLLFSDSWKAISRLIDFPSVLSIIVYDISLLVALVSGILIWRRMRPLQTTKEPMILILHFGFFWLLLSCLGELLANHWSWYANAHVNIHLLTAGALASFALGIMTRIGLAHTGNILKATSSILAIFVLANLGAALFFLTALSSTPFFVQILFLIAACWSGAFLVYLFRFTKILWTSKKAMR